VPTVPPVSGPDAVDRLGATTTLRPTVAVFVVSVTEVAVIVAVKLLLGDAGAV
jgi:hypothetical protein